MKKQATFYPDARTAEQMEDLARWYGLGDRYNTELVARAIDMLWQQENAKQNPPKCENCGAKYQTPTRWIQQCDCD